MMRARVVVLVVLVLCVAAAMLAACSGRDVWSDAEVETLASLSLASLPPPPRDPSNAVADDAAAVALGARLFFDGALSPGGVSCATCHQEALYLSDGRARARGMADFHRHTMTLLGSAWAPWQTWDGKADSQWMQALLPLENPAEQGGDRTAIARYVAQNLAAEYEAVFGALPPLNDDSRFPGRASPVGDAAAREAWASMNPADRDEVNRVFANVGKVIAAFERTLVPGASRFDAYAEAARTGDSGRMRSLFSSEEVAGLRLFLGKGRCIECHNGPLLSNFDFHNTAVPPVAGLPLDHGRAAALASLQASDFNCLGPFSDAAPDDCAGLRFLVTEGATLDGAFRTPTLRNVAETAPYMHAGQFATLEEVVRHYNEGGLQMLGHNELSPLGLSEGEASQIVAFLRTLTQEERSR